MTGVPLRDFELTVLAAVARLGGDAYGLRIQQQIAERHGREYAIGAIYTTLHRLQAKQLVSSHMTESLPVRGGRSRRQYHLSASGVRALQEARERADAVWGGLDIGPEPA